VQRANMVRYSPSYRSPFAYSSPYSPSLFLPHVLSIPLLPSQCSLGPASPSPACHSP
jgi:hypothetical protein